MSVSKELLWKRKKIILSSLGFLVPAILHYKKNEVLLGFLLALMAMSSLQFHLFWKLHEGKVKLPVVYLSVLALVYGTLFYQGVLYRPDISSTCMWFVLLVRSAYKGSRIHYLQYRSVSYALYTFMKWNLYLCLLCLGNYYIRDVSQPIVLVDFIKGMFWGVCLMVSYVLDFNNFMMETFRNYLWRHKPTRMDDVMNDMAIKKGDKSMSDTEDDLD